MISPERARNSAVHHFLLNIEEVQEVFKYFAGGYCPLKIHVVIHGGYQHDSISTNIESSFFASNIGGPAVQGTLRPRFHSLVASEEDFPYSDLEEITYSSYR